MTDRRVTSQPMTPVSGNVLIVTLLATFCVVIAASVIVFISVDDSRNPLGLIGMLLGAFSALVPIIVTLVQVQRMKGAVEYLANGGTDSKVRAAIADVIDPRYLRDDAAGQIAVDRVHRDAIKPTGS